MEKVTLIKVNEVYLKIVGSKSVIREVFDEFKFQIPSAKFDSRVQNGYWDGYIKLLNLKTREIYLGLAPTIVSFLKKSDYEVEIDPAIMANLSSYTIDQIRNFISKLDITDGIDSRDYQEEAIQKAINYSRSLIISPTNSGKSFIQFCLASFYSRVKKVRTLLIVPNRGLVIQMRDDFKSYTTRPLNVQTIDNGKTISDDCQVFVTTWQSITKQPESWFNQFGSVFVDEVHLATAASLKGIMETCKNQIYRHGFSGTLKDTKCHEMVLRGLFGTKIVTTTNKKMIAAGYSTPLQIYPIMVLHNKESIRNALDRINQGKSPDSKIKNLDYNQELSYLNTLESRIEMITAKILSLSGNTLVLFDRIEEEGVLLYENIKRKTNRKIFYVDGSVKGIDRDHVRHEMENSDDVICVASSGVFSTGINIRKMHNLVLPSMGKAKIKLLQSLGRMLRLHDTKDTANIYDFFDDLRCGKKKMNYAMKHFIERSKHYVNEGFIIKQTEVKQL